MKVAVGSDHAGFDLKVALAEELRQRGIEVTDCGPSDRSPVDYPDYAARVAEKVSRGEVDRGVLVCGTGLGMSMAANRFRGVRAAVANDESLAEISRRHNDANVLCLGGRLVDVAQGRQILGRWLETPFDGGRHSARVAKIDSASGCASGGGNANG
jgi:ribose 5-phosphate isomerase B